MNKIRYRIDMLEGLVVKYSHDASPRIFTIQKRKRTDFYWGFYRQPTNKIASFLKDGNQILTEINSGYFIVVDSPLGQNSYLIC